MHTNVCTALSDQSFKLYAVFFSTFGLGPGPLEFGKLATKLEFWEISHFNKPFRLEVCLRYLNNYNNK